MEFPLGGYNQDYGSRLSITSAINCHLEPNSTGTFYRVRRSAGMVGEYDVGLGPVRGVFAIQGELFVVSRNKLYVIDSNDTVTELGDVGGSTTPVFMAANGADDNQVLINSDGKAYIYDENAGTPFQQITDPDLVVGLGVASLNQVFWIPQPSSNVLQGSNTANGLVWDAVRRVNAEQDPDYLVQAIRLTSALWLMGKDGCEYWQTDQTDLTNPIRPVVGATIERGVGADNSIATWQNNAFWLADDLTVWQISGNEATKISDLNLEYAIRGDGKSEGYTKPQSAIGFFIDHPVHKQYVLTFPSDAVTWIYDVTTKLWHTRESKDIGRWRASCSALFNNKVLVGDYRLGKIWRLTEEVNTEDGETIKMQLVPPPIRNKDNDMMVESVELIMEVGVGGISGVDDFGVLKALPDDPKIQVEYSKDGGAIWESKPDLSLGRIGQRDIRVKSRMFGRVRKGYPLLLRYTVTDSVPVEMYELHAEIDV
jgi:hypothetical protein